MATNAWLSVAVPYGLKHDQLTIERGPFTLEGEMRWLQQQATPTEIPRIMTAAVILHQIHPDQPFADCLHTAVIWERG